MIAGNSPIIPIGGMYGAGKSAFKWALKSLLEQNGDAKVFSTTVNNKTTGFSLCTQVADSLNLRDLFGNHYPNNRHEVLNSLGKKIKEVSNQVKPVLIIDDAHFMDTDSYLSVKSLCDLEIDGKRICPVVLLSESSKIEEDLNSGSLAQVRERAQIRGNINAFREIDGFELIVRGLSYAKNDPLDILYNIEDNQPDAFQRCKPFTEAAVATIFALTRVPRQIKQLVVRSVELQAERADDLPQKDKFILTPDIISEAHASLGGKT